eukprot:7649442-Pyramimonas_sp.AAC.1
MHAAVKSPFILAAKAYHFNMDYNAAPLLGMGGLFVAMTGAVLIKVGHSAERFDARGWWWCGRVGAQTTHPTALRAGQRCVGLARGGHKA